MEVDKLKEIRESYQRQFAIQQQRVEELKKKLAIKSEEYNAVIEENKLQKLKIRELEGKLLILVSRFVPYDKREVFQTEFSRSAPKIDYPIDENEKVIHLDQFEIAEADELQMQGSGATDVMGERKENPSVNQSNPNNPSQLEQLKTEDSKEDVYLEEAYENHESNFRLIVLRKSPRF